MTEREREARPPRRYLPELVLVSLTFLWGGTFLATQVGLGHAEPFGFLALRFAIATLLLAMVSPARLGGATGVELRSSAYVGVAMVAGFSLQTFGLLLIDSSKSAFISALYVPLVPIIVLVFLRQHPRRMVWLGNAIALVGLVLLAGPEAIATLTLGRGELLTFVSAIAFAGQIVLMGHFAGRVDAGRASVLQLGFLAVASLLLAVLTGERLPAFSWMLVATAGGLGIASALIQVMINWGQRYVAASRAALIYAAEPVWAGLIGHWAGERLPMLSVVGAALIVGAVVVSELRWPRRTPAA